MSYSKKLIEELNQKAKRLRKDVVISIGVGVAGHIGGSNSATDIVTVLYWQQCS
jgi:transketolase